MKARKATDLRKFTIDELNLALRDAEETVVNLRFQQTLGELQSTTNIRTLRKDIARIKTIIRERETA
jgi:large subunit ribosomal protein L29